MEKENTNGGSVYVTVDGHFKPVHVSMKGTGEKGFLEFMLEDVEKALKETEMPVITCLIWGLYRICGKGTMMIICKGWKRRWTDMESNCIDTCVCQRWCIACEKTWIRCQGTRIISSGLHRRCGGR